MLVLLHKVLCIFNYLLFCFFYNNDFCDLCRLMVNVKYLISIKNISLKLGIILLTSLSWSLGMMICILILYYVSIVSITSTTTLTYTYLHILNNTKSIISWCMQRLIKCIRIFHTLLIANCFILFGSVFDIFSITKG